MEELLIQNRPNLSQGSLKTYMSLLRSIHYNIFGKTIDLDNFNDTAKIMSYLQDKEPSKRKTYLSALYVLTNNPV